jgi:hypothetical protein
MRRRQGGLRLSSGFALERFAFNLKRKNALGVFYKQMRRRNRCALARDLL